MKEENTEQKMQILHTKVGGKKNSPSLKSEKAGLLATP
jgi:hypothetical protein